MKRLIVIALLMLIGFIKVTSAQETTPTSKQEVTVWENVQTVISMHDPDGSKGLLVSIASCEDQEIRVVCVFRTLPDGKPDPAIWNYVQTNRHLFIHDNVKFARAIGAGSLSYRERTRPAWQISFQRRKGEKFPYGAKMDIDRFPVGLSMPVSSARHFLQELVPNKLSSKKTNQRYIAEALGRRKQKERAAVMAATGRTHSSSTANR